MSRTTRGQGGSKGRARVALGAVAVGALALSACGASSSSSSSKSSTPSKSGRIAGTIAFSWWGDTARDNLTYKVISEFKKAYPGVAVTPEPTANYTGYWQHLTVEAAAHDVPCVVTTQNTYLNSYAKPSVLLPLNNLIKQGKIDASGIPQSIIQGGTSGGNTYMLGTGSATTTPVYNETMAKKYGIPPLTDRMTWAQLQTWARHAARRLPSGVKVLDGSSEWATNTLYSWVRGTGQTVYVKSGKGYKLGFTPQTLVNYWNWWTPLVTSGVTTSAAVSAEEPSTAGDDYLAQGKVLAAVDTANLLADQTTLDSNHQGTVADVTFPEGPHGSNGEGFDLSGLSIGANCSNMPAAAAFVSFWAHNAQAIRTYESNNGAVTVTADLGRQVADTSLAPPIRSSLQFFEQLLKADVPVNFDPTGYSTAVTDFETDTQAVQFGKASPAAEAKLFFQQADAALRG